MEIIGKLNISDRKELKNWNDFKLHVWPPEGGGGGGTLIFSHIHRLGLFLGVQNSEFQYYLGFEKNEFFGWYEDFVDIFWGSSQNWAS